MDNSPILSIYVTTYGQERYIAQALDSILMQKTDYKFEVLVGEDASPDGTREILKRYEAEHPGFFTMFYRETNMNSTPVSNSADLRRRTRGKYIICLEGDDYWTDENKLQEQIDFLESHPDYIAVSHNCRMVNENSETIKNIYPECKKEEYTLRDYMMGILPGQTATVMYRNFNVSKDVDTSLFEKKLVPGDRLLYFVLPLYGKVHCIQKEMSAYRYVTKGGASYSANHKFNFEKSERWHHELLNYGKKHGKKAQLCAETLYLNMLLAGYKRKGISFGELLKYTKNIKYKIRAAFLYLIRYVKRHNSPETL